MRYTVRLSGMMYAISFWRRPMVNHFLAVVDPSGFTDISTIRPYLSREGVGEYLVERLGRLTPSLPVRFAGNEEAWAR